MKKENRINLKDEDLWCVYSKERIKIGEEYTIIKENYMGDIINKVYKIEYSEYIDNE